jgi:hypothetical protein
LPLLSFATAENIAMPLTGMESCGADITTVATSGDGETEPPPQAASPAPQITTVKTGKKSFCHRIGESLSRHAMTLGKGPRSLPSFTFYISK